MENECVLKYSVLASVHDSFCCVQVQQLMVTAPFCAELRDLHSTLLQVRQGRKR